MANQLNAKAGGLADVSASLVAELYGLGADVHVALPHYRRMFHMDVGQLISNELRVYTTRLADSRIHLAEDRCFYYRDTVYSSCAEENPRLALAFQREVVNNIIPTVNPDLIHCNDWMTGLVPGAARRLGIPCLFTIHNIHTQHLLLSQAEDAGIDMAEFWRYLYYSRIPYNYEETRESNPVDLLVSGVFAAHFINTVSPTFLREIADGIHSFVPDNLREQIVNKIGADCAEGILNAPDPSYNPATDEALKRRYTPADVLAGKRANKVAFQKKVGLEVNPDAPLFFWPSRLDPMQKGPQLLTDILYRLVSAYDAQGLQIAVVANGSHQGAFHRVVRMHDLRRRVAVCDFQENLSRLGYASSDFTLMPSLFEPCGLPQMIGALYGSMPIVHDTGGLHDTVDHFDAAKDTGNGFVFRHYDSNGLFWAIAQAMEFYALPAEQRAAHLARIMGDGLARFNHTVCAKAYIDIYERMLQRPLLKPFEEAHEPPAPAPRKRRRS
ncbi:MAG: glycogen synthase [Kiritimatiellia bacterium]